MRLTQCHDFNVNDAFKVLVYSKKTQYGTQIMASKITLSPLELNAALMSLPGQMVSGDPQGCVNFCRAYAKDKDLKFEDFINAFLPVNLQLAKKLL